MQTTTAAFGSNPQQTAMQVLIQIMSQSYPADHLQSMQFALNLATQHLGMTLGVICHIEGARYQIEATSNEAECRSDFGELNGLFPGAVGLLEESVFNLLNQSTSLTAIDSIASEKSTAIKSCIGVKLNVASQMIGALMFVNTASRTVPFSVSEQEFIQMLGHWVEKIMHQQALDKALNTSHQRITLALSGGNLGLWEIDLNQRKVIFNERWSQMLGYEPTELSHYLNVWRRLMHRDDLQQVYQNIKQCFEGTHAEINQTFRMRHKAGYWVWVQNHSKVIERNIDGRPIRLMGTNMDISALKKAEEEVEQLAFYDVLTHLPNRRLMLDRLAHALINSARNKTYGALIFIDLDNFKTLNETLGHDKGDILLKEVARRLQACLRDGDTVARFGGDEFVVMLDNLDSAVGKANTQVEKVGNKIIDSLNAPYDISVHQVFSSPTLGATLFNGSHDKIEDALKRADIAMYQAKGAGKNCLRFFDQTIQSHLLHKTKMVEELRVGIEKNQFVLFYQPQIDRHGNITGAEALVRWQHPTRGLVSPLEFIPLAEETGLITQIGCWVLETGCQQLVQWANNPITARYHLSINVSARQFQQSDFVNQVIMKLQKTGANPNKLKLELTESMLVDDVDDVITKMSKLRVLGVSFSLDDFGTGFSSLSFLKLLPLNQLKIDKSFVRDILTDTNDAVIARTIVALANSLGLNVIAEGVELEGQRAFLSKHGCHDYQGYLFSRPLTEQQFHAFCQSYKAPVKSKFDLLDDDDFPLL